MNQLICNIKSIAHQYRGKFELEESTERVAITTLTPEDIKELNNAEGVKRYESYIYRASDHVMLDVAGRQAIVKIEDLYNAVAALSRNSHCK